MVRVFLLRWDAMEVERLITIKKSIPLAAIGLIIWIIFILICTTAWGFVGGSTPGFGGVSLRNPTKVREIVSGTFLNNVWALAVSGNYLYATTMTANAGRLTVIDIGTPTGAEIVGSLNLAGKISFLKIAGNIAYLSGYQQQKIILVDISDKRNPTKISEISDPNHLINVVGLELKGKYLFAAASGNAVVDYDSYLVSIDISDPNNPRIEDWIGDTDPNNTIEGIHHLDIRGDYLYATIPPEQRLNNYDISNPNNIQLNLTSVRTVYNTSRDLDIVGNHLITSAITGGTTSITDITNPDDIRLKGYVTGLGDCRGATAVNGYAFTADYSGDDFYILDISDPNAPSVISVVSDPNMLLPRDVVVSGRYAYISCADTDRIMVIDLTGTDIAVANISDINTTIINTNDINVGEACNVMGDLSVGNFAMFNNDIVVQGDITTMGEIKAGDVAITGGTITGLTDLDANSVDINGGTITGITNLEVTGGTITGITDLKVSGANGEFLQNAIRSGTVNLSGATSSWSEAILAGRRILGVNTYVTATITGSGVTGYTVGDGTDADRWGAITGTAIGTASAPDNYTDESVMIYNNLIDIVITAAGGSFTGGTIRVVIYYQELGVPTS